MLGKRGSVMLFVRGLPKDVTRKELKTFIQGTVKEVDNRPFSLKATVCNCSILRITDPDGGTDEYHGLVEVQPAKAAIEAIDILNRRKINGHELEVRRYQPRSLLRDHRAGVVGYGAYTDETLERRRRNLRIDLVSA